MVTRLATLDGHDGEEVSLEPPTPASQGGGRYRSRCALATAECAMARPELQRTADGRQLVAC